MLDDARGWRLADMRKRREMTQEQVAARMGVSVARVSQIERGDVSTQDVLNRYITALGGTLKLIADFGDEQLKIAPERAATSRLTRTADRADERSPKTEFRRVRSVLLLAGERAFLVSRAGAHPVLRWCLRRRWFSGWAVRGAHRARSAARARAGCRAEGRLLRRSLRKRPGTCRG